MPPIVLAICIFALALLAFYAPFLDGARNFFYSDTTFFLEPHAKFLAAALRVGHLPLWNPLNYCGMPQIAVTFPSLFYPPDWLLVSLPFSSGLALNMMFHLSIAATGTFLLLRSFSYTPLQSLVAAAIYSLSGYMFGLASNNSLVAGAAWCPFSLWTLRTLEFENSTRKFWAMLRCSGAILMLLLSGRPEIILPGIGVLLAYVLGTAFLRAKKHQASRDESLIWQSRAIFLAFTLSLPAILPVAEWLSMSRRASGLQIEEVFLYSARWYDVVSMLLGPSLGDLRLHGAQFRSLVSFANLPPFVSCAYVGPVAICLALWGALDKTWRWRWLILSLLALTLLASLGDSTPVVPYIVRTIPALGFVRFPIKLLVFSILCFAILASHGMSCHAERRVRFFYAASVWCMVGALGIGLCLLTRYQHIALPFSDPLAPATLQLRAQELIGMSAIGSSAIGLILCAVTCLTALNKLSNRWTGNAILIALCGSLLFNAFKFERSGADAKFWSIHSVATEALKTIEHQDGASPGSRIFNLCIERFTVPQSYLPLDQASATVADYQYNRQILKANSNIDFFLPETYGFEGTAKGDYANVALHSYLESSQSVRPEVLPPTDFPLARLCAITSTNYVITQTYRTIGRKFPVPLLDDRLFRIAYENQLMNIRIYRVLSSLPRYYLSSHWRWADSHNQILDGIVSSGASEIDPIACTLIESQNKSSSKIFEPGSVVESDSTNTINFVINDPERVRLNVKVSRPSFLVTSDQYYPGWEATVDSHPEPIYIANGFNRALHLPPGDHVVEFNYNPESLRLGILLAAIGVLLACYLYWFDKKQNACKLLK